MSRLFLKISLGILLTLVVSSIIASELLRVQIERDMGKREPHPLRGESLLIQRMLDRVPAAELPQEIQKLRLHYPVPIVLVEAADTALASGAGTSSAGGAPNFDHFQEEHKVYIPLHGGRKTVILGPYRHLTPFRLGHLILVLGVILPVVCLVGFILALPLVRGMRKLELAALQVGEGNLGARARIDSSDAMGDLARRFNQMAQKLQVLLEGQQHLLEAVSHELRTPIARIGFMLEMLSTSRNDQDRSQRIQEIETELQELNQLVNELLLYLRFDAKRDSLRKESISIPEALREPMTRQGELHPDKALDIEAGSHGDVVLYANQSLFRRAVENLLSNALRHASRKVTVLYDRNESGVVIEVIDDGPGIPPEAREMVFEPFARVDDGRSRETGGTGLGLAIVKRIVESHGGSIHIVDGHPGGSRFVTVWPVSQAPPGPGRPTEEDPRA